jgi:hypothetical protein
VERERPPEAGICYDFEWKAERQFSAAGEAIDDQISMSGSWWLRLCIGEGDLRLPADSVLAREHREALDRRGKIDGKSYNTSTGWCTAVTTLTATSLLAQSGLVRQGMQRLRE